MSHLTLFFLDCFSPQYKEIKKADPLTLMTMCFKEVGALSSARAIMDNLVVGMDKVRKVLGFFVFFVFQVGAYYVEFFPFCGFCSP